MWRCMDNWYLYVFRLAMCLKRCATEFSLLVFKITSTAGLMQDVSDGKRSSSTSKVLNGIRQGSVIGPQRFSLYTNYFIGLSYLYNFTLSADDSINTNHIPRQVRCWVLCNKLNLNTEKSFVECHQKEMPHILLRINCKIIKRTYYPKFL